MHFFTASTNLCFSPVSIQCRVWVLCRAMLLTLAGSKRRREEARRAEARFRIHISIVRPHGRESICLRVEALNTINNVKATLQNITNIPADQQRLALFHYPHAIPTFLENGLTLSDYNIQDAAWLSLTNPVP